MLFIEELSKNKKCIFDKWFACVVESYSITTSDFLKSKKDPFINPVRSIIRESVNGLLEGLITKTDFSELKYYLDSILRVRAVQNFKPSESISFVFDLKKIVRECLEIKDDRWTNVELESFDQIIDNLAMIAFDVYMACKEQIYELKANEARNQFFGSLSRAGLIVEGT